MDKYYFASDVHLGFPPYDQALKREKLFVKWLDMAKKDAKAIFLLGDIFDFWFEYKLSVPKGFVRTLGKLAEITDSGIPVHFFIGNHDLWVRDYLPRETGVIMHYNPYELKIEDKLFYLAHGDALDNKDIGMLFLRKIFTNSISYKLFSAIHPRIGIAVAHKWSHRSRLTGSYDSFKGETEGIYIFARETSKIKPEINYFIFGHRHTPLIRSVDGNENVNLVILGEWLENPYYAVFDGENLELNPFSN